MNDIVAAIFTGIVATSIFELLKFSYCFWRDRIAEKELPFSLAGYWCAYHESKDSKTQEIFSACELVRFCHKHDMIHMKLYQITNDGRCQYYKGIGYFRGNKITLSYCEADRQVSNHAGAFLLREKNIIEHVISLTGNYAEFRGDSFRARLYPYNLKPCGLTLSQQIAVFFTGKKAAYSLMKKKAFQDECKNTMQ